MEIKIVFAWLKMGSYFVSILLLENAWCEVENGIDTLNVNAWMMVEKWGWRLGVCCFKV